MFPLCLSSRFCVFSGCEVLKERGVTEGVLAKLIELAARGYDMAASLVVGVVTKSHIRNRNVWFDKAAKDKLQRIAPRMG